MEDLGAGCQENFREKKMKKSLLDLLLERHGKNNEEVTGIYLTYNGFVFDLQHPFWGYVWEEARGEDEMTREYGWRSMEEFLDDTMIEVGKTFREVLASVDAEEAEIGFQYISPELAEYFRREQEKSNVK